MRVEPFSIHVEEDVLSDLRERIRKTRGPDPAPGSAWEQGTDLEYLRQLLAYWADEFDWRAQERELNGFEQDEACGQGAAQTPAQVQLTVDSGGFDWGDAGIGAATAFGLVLVVAGGALGLRATDDQQKRP